MTYVETALDAKGAQAAKLESLAALAEIQKVSASSSLELKAVEQQKGEAKDATDKIQKQLADNAALLAKISEAQKKAEEYEGRIFKFSTDIEKLEKEVKGLLPGATSAGLASSFHKQKLRFVWPKRCWIGCFILCVLALVAVGFPTFLSHLKSEGTSSWDTLVLEAVERLPLVIPLVWLAIYAGRNYMTTVRMEEDYAYKEAVSTVFEGYKTQMQSIGDASKNDSPLFILCSNVLSAMAERPGRIYERKIEDITPMNEAKNGARDLKDRAVTKIP